MRKSIKERLYDISHISKVKILAALLTYLTPLRQELANLPVEPFFLIFRRFLKIEEKNEDSLNS